jgi:hypothetical protein
MTKRAIILSLPPFILLGIYACAFVVARYGPGAFSAMRWPMQVGGPACMVAALGVSMHLWSQRQNKDLRLPLILNCIAAAMLLLSIAALVFVFVSGKV